MRLILLLSTLFIACAALQCYQGFNVYNQPSRRKDLMLVECPNKGDCCAVVWYWYGGYFNCFSGWHEVCPINKINATSGEYCIGAFNGHGFDGPMDGPHYCGCNGTVGHCMPNFPEMNNRVTAFEE